jgi:predicted lipoprotein
LPGYQAVQDSAATLKEETDTFCAQTEASETDLQAFQDDWKAFNQSWQAIQWVKVGPVVSENRLFRIQFFPDTNDAVSRGVENLLLETQTVTAELVAGQNVGGQGIPAMEYLLFPASASDSLLTASDAEKRCELLTAIAQNLLNICTEINAAWSISGGNYREQLISGTGDFTSAQDGVEELVTNWLEAVELVKDEKMLIPLGSDAPGFPGITEFVLSDESFASISTNLDAFAALYSAGGGRGFDYILSTVLEQESINTEMTEAIQQTITAFEAMHQNFQSYPELLNSPDGRQQLTTVIDELRDVRDILSSSFVQALDINIGFNANDGD